MPPSLPPNPPPAAGWSLLQDRRQLARLVAALVAAAGFALSFGAWVFMRSELRESERARFDHYTDLIGETVRGQLTTAEHALRGGAALAQLHPRVSADVWGTYVENLAPLLREGVLSLGYAEQTAGGCVVRQVLPRSAAEFERGRNLREGPRRLEAATTAMETGQAALTRMILLRWSGHTATRGFLLFQPVYRKGTHSHSIVERADELQGLVFAALEAPVLLQRVKDDLPPNLAFAVYDGLSTSETDLIFSSPGDGQRGFGPVLRSQLPLALFGRSWTIVASQSGSLNAQSARLVGLVLAGGMVISVLAAVLAGSLLSMHERDLRAREAIEREMVRRETMFQRIFELAPVGLSWVGSGGAGARMVNPTHSRIAGLTADKAHNPRNFLAVTHPEDLPRQMALQEKLNRGEIDRFSVEKRYVHADGSIVWAVLTIMTFPDPQTGTRHEVATLVDVTELKRQAAELERAKDAAEQANLAKSQFLAVISHEIRTPMNGIIGMTNLMLGTALSRDQREFADTIRQSAAALLHLINDILDFSKIDGGHLELESEAFDLRECVEGALDLLAPQAAAKSVELLCDLMPDVPAIIVGDSARLRQILVNLLGNAVKFTERGEVVVVVRAGERRGERLELLVAVRDSGIGIPADAMARLFRSFSQGDASTTRKYGGTGLGLAISRRLAELMGGRMWVESEVGKGSAFHFSIGIEPGEPVPSPDTSRFLNRRILLAVPNAAARAAYERVLQGWQLQTAAVASGSEAVLRLGEEPFDAVVADHQLTDLRGTELAEELGGYRQFAGLPVVLLAPVGAAGDATALPANVLTRLIKPLKPEALRKALSRLFAGGPPRTEAAALPPPPVAESAAATRPRERILVVEDNAINQKVVRLMLSQLGYRPDISGNGLEAVEAFGRFDYDIVLMDLQMPVMDGFEAALRIRALKSDLPTRPWIVAVTANAMEGFRERCLAAGMNDYLSKPIMMDDLVAVLARARAQAAAEV